MSDSQRLPAPLAPAQPVAASMTPDIVVVAEPSPMRHFAWLALAVFATLAGALLLWQFRSVVLLLVAALALAATMRPLAETLTGYGLPRGLSITLLVLVVVIGLLLLLGVTGYVLADNLPRAASDVQRQYAALRSQWTEGSAWQQTMAAQLPPPAALEDLVVRTELDTAPAAGALLSATTTPTATAAATATTSAAPMSTAAAAPTTSETRASGLLRVIVGATSSVGGLLTQFIVLVFLSLYWSLERDWFERLWISLLPAPQRRAARKTWRAVESGVGAHIRSELVQMALAFGVLFAGFWLMGAQYPLLMAWAAALASLIPLVGWLAALAPVIALGLLTSPLVAAGAALLLTLVLALLEFVVEPRLDVRRRAGSILGLIVALVMLEAFGLLGLLVASPVAVTLDILSRRLAAPPAATLAPVQAADPVEQLEIRLRDLRAAMGRADIAIPMRTRNLYERLQMLVGEAEKSL